MAAPPTAAVAVRSTDGDSIGLHMPKSPSAEFGTHRLDVVISTLVAYVCYRPALVGPDSVWPKGINKEYPKFARIVGVRKPSGKWWYFAQTYVPTGPNASSMVGPALPGDAAPGKQMLHIDLYGLIAIRPKADAAAEDHLCHHVNTKSGDKMPGKMASAKAWVLYDSKSPTFSTPALLWLFSRAYTSTKYTDKAKLLAAVKSYIKAMTDRIDAYLTKPPPPAVAVAAATNGWTIIQQPPGPTPASSGNAKAEHKIPPAKLTKATPPKREADNMSTDDEAEFAEIVFQPTPLKRRKNIHHADTSVVGTCTKCKAAVVRSVLVDGKQHVTECTVADLTKTNAAQTDTIAELTKTNAAQTDRIADLTGQIAELTKKNVVQTNEITDLDTTVATHKAVIADLDGQLAATKTDAAGEKETLNAIIANIDGKLTEALEQLDATKTEAATLNATITDLDGKLGTAKQTETTLLQQLEAQTAETERLKAELIKTTTERDLYLHQTKQYVERDTRQVATIKQLRAECDKAFGDGLKETARLKAELDAALKPKGPPKFMSEFLDVGSQVNVYTEGHWYVGIITKKTNKMYGRKIQYAGPSPKHWPTKLHPNKMVDATAEFDRTEGAWFHVSIPPLAKSET